MDIVKIFKHAYLRFYVNYYLPQKGIRIIEADTDAELQKLFHVRWQVYVDSEYIDPRHHPKHEFRDKYDPYSIKFLAIDKNVPVGTSRLVVDSKLGFPLESYYNVALPEDREKGVEVSRLAVLSSHRGDKRHVAIALLHSEYEWSKKNRLKYWYMFMPEKLTYAFSDFGAVFHELEQKELDESHKNARTPMAGYFKKTKAKPYILYLDELEHNLRHLKINW